MDRLIEASDGSPQTLIRLCRSLFIHDVERTDEALIDSHDVVNTLTAFLQRLEVERTEASLVPESKVSVFGSAPSAPPERGLFLDKSSGHVRENQSRLTPPLSAQEFRLLKVLYSGAPNIVSKEELLKAIRDDATLNGPIHDKQYLRKLVSRLRERLEPGVPRRHSSYVRNVRGRGYWLLKRSGDPE
jgi:DNA-binding response OmpR family regulator